jgi:hypothetical protein
MPFASQPAPEQATLRDKRRILLVVAAVVLVVAGAAIWGVLRPGSYGPSADGCITVTLASSTGGSVLHQCGTAAKSTCKYAYAHSDRASVLTRAQCRLAGIPAARAGSSTPPG